MGIDKENNCPVIFLFAEIPSQGIFFKLLKNRPVSVYQGAC